jgi:hypothetical protein
MLRKYFSVMACPETDNAASNNQWYGKRHQKVSAPATARTMATASKITECRRKWRSVLVKARSFFIGGLREYRIYPETFKQPELSLLGV